MTLRHVDIALRHKVFLLLPVLLGLAAGIAWMVMSLEDRYVSTANVWVERPSIETGGSITEFDQWTSPAQNEANSMREMLSTRSFREDVLARINEEASPSPAGAMTPEQLTKQTFISPTGKHVVSLSHQSASPDRSHAVVRAILDAYTELYASQIIERAQSSEQFFEEQLAFAGGNLERAHTELSAYLSDNPIATDDDEPLTAEDIEAAATTDLSLARLVGAKEIARENYDSLFARFAETQIAANSAAAGNAYFRVIDEPQVPVSPREHGERDVLLKPMLGLVAGSFLSGGLFILVSRLDRHVWLPADLKALGLAVPIMTLPQLKSPTRRWPRTFLRLSTAMRSGLRGW